jgi:hypothetical protein
MDVKLDYNNNNDQFGERQDGSHHGSTHVEYLLIWDYQVSFRPSKQHLPFGFTSQCC